MTKVILENIKKVFKKLNASDVREKMFINESV